MMGWYNEKNTADQYAEEKIFFFFKVLTQQ